MDLGCIDLGCIEKDDQFPSVESGDSSSSSSSSSATKHSKNKSPKASPPSANALKRVTSQIRKPPHRKTSPVNWFPRKKVESYLKRKIKSLQEAGGMNDTLDETLGHTNPQYCRVLREKMAAKEAACKVMEARKAAMGEASWCRILQAARIFCPIGNEENSLLIKAEKEVAEAIEAAKAKGVTMYDTTDRPRKHLEIETSSNTGKGSTTTHTVKASFETAFEVDKQVAAAVKTAFVRLAHSSSCNKDEYKDLLKKINENPDTQELSDTDNVSEETEICDDGSKLVNMMFERLKSLKEEELASLATIVATCGLNASLSEIGSHNTAKDRIEVSSIEHFMHGVVKKKSDEPELPSLEKFLVKKMTRLEKEVQEAKNARKSESKKDDDGKNVTSGVIPDLVSVLVKHSSKLEKEIEAAMKNQKLFDSKSKTRELKQEDGDEVLSLDKFLVKHVTKLEREVQEAKNRQKEKENVDSNMKQNVKNEKECESLDKCLIKHVSKLEKAKMEVGSKETYEVKKKNTTMPIDSTVGGSLDEILVKPKSRIEKEKSVVGFKDGNKNSTVSRREARERELLETWGGIGLGGTMRPNASRLQREKAAWIKAEEQERNAALQELA